MPWRKEWQPTPIFLSGEFRGQRECHSLKIFIESAVKQKHIFVQYNDGTIANLIFEFTTTKR